MPYIMRKLPNQNKFRVFNKDTGKVFAKATSKRKAERQIRYLQMVHNKNNPKNKMKVGGAFTINGQNTYLAPPFQRVDNRFIQ